MTDDRPALDQLEDPMIELGTLSRSLRQMTMQMERHSPLHIVLHSIANHLDHIHDDLYEHYEAVTAEAPREHPGPRVVS